MKGKYNVIVSNNKLRYEFTIKRNITIIKGDSATGKTTLIDMLRQYSNLGDSSGINVSCDVKCRVLEGQDWKLLLSGITNTIFFIDEENQFIATEEFAKEVKKSDNYFVLITRENLYNLPYSVEEIYGIHSSGKYNETKKFYQEFYRIYPNSNEAQIAPTGIVVEDSNAGYEFFKQIARDNNLQCESANGKSNICDHIEGKHSKEICVIADGAAFGPEMEKVYSIVQSNSNIKLYLPESFEWLILKSGLIESKGIQEILEAPEEWVDGKEFFSWERYFTNLLVHESQDTYLKYNKSKLNNNYLQEKSKKMILDQIEGINFNQEK